MPSASPRSKKLPPGIISRADLGLDLTPPRITDVWSPTPAGQGKADAEAQEIEASPYETAAPTRDVHIHLDR